MQRRPLPIPTECCAVLCCRVQIASVYMEQGDTEAALSTYMTALEHSPDNPELLTTVGITFLRCAPLTQCGRSAASGASCMDLY